MSIVAVSFTSESADHYLSLFTDISSVDDFLQRIVEEYDEEFAFLYIDGVCTDDGTEEELTLALGNKIEEVRASHDFYS